MNPTEGKLTEAEIVFIKQTAIEKVKRKSAIEKAALDLFEQGFLADLPNIQEEGQEIDLNERFLPLWKACSGTGKAKKGG